MKWEILILTQPSRAEFLDQLLSILMPQCQNRDVEVLIGRFDPGKSLGENREILRRQSSGDYINFVDDDDFVAGDYVAKILPLLHGGIDQIGFRLQLYSDGSPMIPTYHSLKYGRWYEDARGYYRDISHLNPMRRELAMSASMDGGIGEDCRWSIDLRNLGIVKTEHFIDEILYYYFFRSTKRDATDWQIPDRLAALDKLRASIV